MSKQLTTNQIARLQNHAAAANEATTFTKEQKARERLDATIEKLIDSGVHHEDIIAIIHG